jgi:hypothetical protein
MGKTLFSKLKSKVKLYAYWPSQMVYGKQKEVSGHFYSCNKEPVGK